MKTTTQFHSRNIKRMKGYGLIEYMIAGTLAALLLAIVFANYATQSKEQVIDEAVTTLRNAGIKIASNNSQIGNLAGFNTSSCYVSNAFPESWLDRGTPGQFNTPFTSGATALTCTSLSTATDVLGNVLTGTNKFLSMTLNSVDATSCNSIAKQLFTDFTEIQIGGTRVNSGALIDTNCGTDPAALLAMTFIKRI